MSQHTNADTDHASIPDQFASGETLVECYAGARAGTGKTTRLIEWFREQHDDEAAWLFIDPAADTLPETDEERGFTSVSIDPRHATYKYNVADGRNAQPDDEEDTP